MGVGDHATPGLFYLREWPCNKCRGGWVGPQGRFERVRKISPTPGFDAQTVQPVASRYTDWAIPAHHLTLVIIKKPALN